MSIVLRNHPNHHNHRLKHLLTTLIRTRPMGGGPRTFPGGLNKWQWKRLHEKKARYKEKRLLDQEKQLYQARLRSQVRASVDGNGDPVNNHSHAPLSPQDHVKALADRFVKPGAEDLWNQNDGPLTVQDVEVMETVQEMNQFNGNLQQKRGYRAVNLVNFRIFGGNSSNSGDFRVCGGNFEQRREFSSNLVNARVFGGNFEQRREFSSNFGDFRVFRGNLEQRREFSSNLANFRAFGGHDPRREFSSNLGDFRVFGGNFEQMREFSSNSANFRVFGGHFEPRREFSSNSANCRVFGGNFEQRREFSSNVRQMFMPKDKRIKKKMYKDSSSDDDDEDYGVVAETVRWPKFKVEDTKKGRNEEDERGKGARGFIGGSGVLGKYDVKIRRRLRLNQIEEIEEEEEEEGLRNKVEEIRKEIIERKMGEKAVEERGSSESDAEVVDDFVAGGKRFDECGISPLTVKALTDAGYVTMTRVQEETLSLCLEGKDVLAKARAGTGKTIAFLLPGIETVLMGVTSNKVPRVPPVYVLVLCPTRELASQIAAETRVLLKHHDGLGVQVLSGGTRFKDDLKHLELDPCQILVATPGRLLDHIESRSGLSARLMGLRMLVLDEADHLLDLGFRKDIERIVDCLPRRRQSLLFSATVPKEVRRVSQLVLNREHASINTVDVGSLETNFRVKQSYIVAAHDLHFQVVYQLLKEHVVQTPDYKVIVFCTTGMVTSLMYLLFREMRLNVREIHSRKPQLYRTRVADEFKQSKRMILISSDVSARGMNYPDVSLVIQVGIPSDRHQYIHRIGRTGREGKEGEGILVLAPWEEHFLDEIRDLDVERQSTPLIDSDLKSKMENSMSKVDTSVKEAAYHAWLGYYNSIRETGRDKTSLVNWANQFSESIGLQKPPSLFRKTLVKMGLKNIPGIRVRK